MNHIQASCGHMVPAEGSPGSFARLAAERRHCGKPRCESGLPAKFSDRECTAWAWLKHCYFRGWSVDLKTREVHTAGGRSYIGLIEYATHCGWEG